jgi:hypothetical protein
MDEPDALELITVGDAPMGCDKPLQQPNEIAPDLPPRVRNGVAPLLCTGCCVLLMISFATAFVVAVITLYSRDSDTY